MQPTNNTQETGFVAVTIRFPRKVWSEITATASKNRSEGIYPNTFAGVLIERARKASPRGPTRGTGGG